MFNKIGSVTGKFVAWAALAATGGLYLHSQNEVSELKNEILENKENFVKVVEDIKGASRQEIEQERLKSKTNLETQNKKFLELAEKQKTNEQLTIALLDLPCKVEKMLAERYKLTENRVENLENLHKVVTENVRKVETKLSNVKTDEQIKTEVLAKARANTVHIRMFNSRGEGQMTGGVITDKKGNIAILTAGHSFKSSEEFLESEFIVTFPNGVFLDMVASKLPDGIVPWSSYDDRDVALLMLPQPVQDTLKKKGITGLPVLSAKETPPQGSKFYIVGREWRDASGDLVRNHTYWHLNKKRRDFKTNALVGRGDSGSLALDSKGRIVAMVSWGYDPQAVILEGGKVRKDLTVSIRGVNSQNHLLVSSGDMQRALRSWGLEIFEDEDRNHLLKQDILEDRPQLLVPPLPNISDLTTYLGRLVILDGYAFKK